MGTPEEKIYFVCPFCQKPTYYVEGVKGFCSECGEPLEYVSEVWGDGETEGGE